MGLLTSNLENSSPVVLMIRTEMRSSNVTAESIMLRREALDEVVAVALIFSDCIFVVLSLNFWHFW